MHREKNEIEIYRRKDNAPLKVAVIICTGLIVLILISGFLNWYDLQYRGIHPHPGRGTIENMPRFILILSSILIFGLLSNRKPLIIYENGISLPLRRYNLTSKSFIELNEIASLSLERYVVQLETADGKTYLLTHPKNWHEIYPILKKACGDNWNKIKVDEEMLKLGE